MEPEVQMFPGDVATFDVSAPRWRFWRRWERQTLTVRCLNDGTLLIGGIAKLSASTGTKEHGTRTLETGTTADSSSCSARPEVSVSLLAPTSRRLVNNSTVPGSFSFVTGGRGVSGEPRESAG